VITVRYDPAAAASIVEATPGPNAAEALELIPAGVG
jgi:hypothetical protein